MQAVKERRSNSNFCTTLKWYDIKINDPKTKQIMENIGLWAANNASDQSDVLKNKSRQSKLKKEYIWKRGSEPGRPEKPAKNPAGKKKGRKSGTGQAQLVSPARTTSLIDCRYQKAIKIDTIDSKL